jgi:hypothetical protein
MIEGAAKVYFLVITLLTKGKSNWIAVIQITNTKTIKDTNVCCIL